MDILLWEQIPEDAKESSPLGLKPEEEIARFTVDEHLSESERINLFITGGHAVQQRRAVDSLPVFLKAKGRAGWETVQSNLLQTLPKLELETQVAFAEALNTAVQQHALLSADIAECLLPLAMDYVRSKETSEEESEAWLLLLLEMLPVISRQQLLEVVLPLAQHKGQVNESVLSRVSCCRMLGGMAPHLSPSVVASQFASQLLAACQDTDYQVRIAAAQQLPVLARVLSPSAVLQKIIPELKELLEDDEVQVRVSGLSGLVTLCQLLPREVRVSQLLPLVRQHMQPLELALPLQRALATAFPRLLDAIRDDLEPSDAGLLYGCFRHLAARSDVELRRICASQLPLLMASPLPGSSASYLHDTWTDLALDHDVQVRAAIASQFHQVACSVPAADAAQLLKRPLVTLLKDSTSEVRSALLPGLADTLQILAGIDDMHKDSVAIDVHQALMVLMSGTAHNWRCQAQLAAALPALPGLLGADVLSEQWTPFAFNLLLTGAACVKPIAAAGVMHLLRGCRRERQRTELYCRMIRELAWGRSCWARQAYIQICVAALPLFSCRWVKEHLLEGLVQMLSDAVPNVRLAALGLLPALKQTIKLPEDVERLEQLNSAMSNLMTDKDRDVSHAARGVHDTFKRTPLKMTGGAGLLDMNGSASGSTDSEACDAAKEQFEAEQLVMNIEELEKLRVDYMAFGTDRRGRRLPAAAADPGSSNAGGGSSRGDSNSGAGGHVVPGLGKKNSKGRIDTHSAGNNSNGSRWESAATSSSSSSFVRSGTGFTSQSWSPDKRFGAGVCNSSSSSSSSPMAGAAGLNLKPMGTNTSTAAGSGGKGSAIRAGGGGFIGGSSSSSSSSSSLSAGSPRHGPAAAAAYMPGSSNCFSSGSSSSSSLSSPKVSVGAPGFSSALGPPMGSTAAAAPAAAAAAALQSPTGSSLMGNLRLPVLAGSPKAAFGGSSSQYSSGVGLSSSSSVSRLGSGFNASLFSSGGVGSSGLVSQQLLRQGGSLGAAAAAAAAAAPSNSMFRHGVGLGEVKGGSSSSSSSSSSRVVNVGIASKYGSSSAAAAAGSKLQAGSGGSRLLGVQGSSATSDSASRRYK